MHFFGTLAVLSFAVAALGLGGLLLLLWFAPGSPFWASASVVCGLATVLAGGFAGQCVLTGFVAELLTARRTDDPFEVSETTPERVP